MISATSPNPIDVAIVGGGACGIALLVELLERVKQGKPVRSVSLFEKGKTVGPGLAYSEACQGTKINMRSETMGLRVADPKHFVTWMKARYPDLNVDTYLPRLKYGEYLCAQKAAVKEEADSLGLKVNSVSDEVVALDRTDSGFDIKTINNERYQASDVVLALGNFMAPKYTSLSENLGYFPFPWPNERLKLISRDSAVGVVGSRLTAIDVALCLADNGHTGPITLFSRSGRLPKVQTTIPGPYQKYRLFEIARELESQPGDALPRLTSAMRSEIERDTSIDWPSVMSTPQDALAELESDIQKAETGGASWQHLLNGTSGVVERYWDCFSVDEKRSFIDNYQSTWMVYRHAMPLVTARRVMALMAQGQLRVRQMQGAPQKEPSGFSIPTAGEAARTDFVIEATGPECNALRVPSKLLHNCLGSGLLEADPFGGVKVDPQTMEASPRLSVIGSLTRGVHFYSTAIDRNVAHTERLVDRLVDEPPRRPLHIAFFVGTDICSQLMVSKLVPQLLSQGHMPYVFLPAHKASKRATKFELRELAFFERLLLQDHVIPAIREQPSEDASCLTVDQLSERYGILVEHVPDVNDPAFLQQMESHHVDVGMSIRCYQKFGKDIIRFFNAPRAGLLNLHPGALPQYRGVMTTIRAMANREKDFGYSLHSINEDWDAGDLIDIQTGPINYKRAMLSAMTELYDVGVKVATDAFDAIGRGHELPSVPQDEDKKGYYTFPTREELDDYRDRGLRLVDADFMKDFLVSAFSSANNRDFLARVVQDAVQQWYEQNS